MTIIPFNLITLPLLLIVWTADLYLFAICLRLLLGRLVAVQGTTFYSALCELTGPVRGMVDRCFSTIWRRPITGWVVWAVVILALFILRHLLLFIIVPNNS